MSRGRGLIVRVLMPGLFAFVASAALAQGNPVAGKSVFDNNCSGCHVLTGQGFGGPALSGVFGRQAASAPGFTYSDAMKKSGIVWDDTSLDDFLANPSKTVPGTSMYFNLSSPQDRDDVIAYLKSLSPASH